VNLLVLHSELGVLQGGGETFTRNLFTAFAERGHRVTAAFIADSCGNYRFHLPRCIESVPIPGWWSRKLGQATLSSIGKHIPFGGVFRVKWDWAQEAICWRSIRWHNQRFQRHVEQKFASRWSDFDVIYVQSNVPLAKSIAAHHPTVLMLPGPVDSDLVPSLIKIPAVCAHDDGLSRMRTLLGDHVLELPLGLDTQLFSPEGVSVRSTLGWSDQDCVIGYVGRFTRLKGTDLLAAAFRQIERTAKNVRFLLVGSGEEETNIRSALEEEIACGIVHIEPAMAQEELPSWYRAMDLVVMPSRYETMSNALLEAMACGIPFLASNVGGNIILERSGAGWLFESESVASLSKNLSCLIEKSHVMKIRGQVARHYVQQTHSWKRTAERLEKIIHTRLGVRR